MKYGLHIGDEKARFVLGHAGIKPLFIVGVNPSTADQSKSDRTMDKVETLAHAWGYEGLLMLNLYPLRSSKPRNLPLCEDPALVEQNSNVLLSQFTTVKHPAIWAAWGDAIELRGYLFDCLARIHEAAQRLHPNWMHCGTLTKSQNPRHPLQRSTPFTAATSLTSFDMKWYLGQKGRG